MRIDHPLAFSDEHLLYCVPIYSRSISICIYIYGVYLYIGIDTDTDVDDLPSFSFFLSIYLVLRWKATDWVVHAILILLSLILILGSNNSNHHHHHKNDWLIDWLIGDPSIMMMMIGMIIRMTRLYTWLSLLLLLLPHLLLLVIIIMMILRRRRLGIFVPFLISFFVCMVSHHLVVYQSSHLHPHPPHYRHKVLFSSLCWQWWKRREQKQQQEEEEDQKSFWLGLVRVLLVLVLRRLLLVLLLLLLLVMRSSWRGQLSPATKCNKSSIRPSLTQFPTHWLHSLSLLFSW